MKDYGKVEASIEAPLKLRQVAGRCFVHPAAAAEQGAREILCRFVVILTAAEIYGATVIRHTPVAVLDRVSEEPLWVHPSADAFDLARSPAAIYIDMPAYAQNNAL